MNATVESPYSTTVDDAPTITFSTSSHNKRLTAEELKRNQRIEEFLPLVRNVLRKLQRKLPSHVDMDALYGAGVMGLIAAVDRFDASKAATFPGYACLRIRCAILDELRRSDPCPRRVRVQNRLLTQASDELEQALGRGATDRELSAHLGISVAQLGERRALARPVRIISLDGDPKNDDAVSTPLHELIADENHACVRDSLENEEMKELLAEHLGALPDMPKRILAFYYFEGMRFGEIAEVFGLTESRISQIHRETLGKLQAMLKKHRK